MKTKILFFIALVCLTQLSGCAHKAKTVASNSKSELHKAEVELATAANSVSKSLQELVEINRAAHPHAKLSQPLDPMAIGMGQLGSIDWNGPVAPLVKKIAEATGYKLKTLGTAPAIPILVSVNAKDTPLADILRDAEFQCGNRANIVVYPATKIIELRYPRAKAT